MNNNNILIALTSAILETLKALDVTQGIDLKPVYSEFEGLCKEHLSLTCEPPAILTKGFNKALSAVFSSGQAQTATLKMREDCKSLAIDRLETGLKHGKPLCLYSSDVQEFDVKQGASGSSKAKHDFDGMINALTVLSDKNFATPEGLELNPLDLAKKSEKPYLMAREFFEESKQGLTAKEWNDIYSELIEDVILSRVTGHESVEYQAIDNALRLIEHIKLNAAKAVEAAKQDKIAALKAKLKRA